MTSKNQLTLPRSVTDQIEPTEYFDVEVRDGQLVLTPVRIQRADAVRAKLAALGLQPGDLQDAIRWARQGSAGAPAALEVAEPRAAYRAGRASRAAPSKAKRKG